MVWVGGKPAKAVLATHERGRFKGERERGKGRRGKLNSTLKCSGNGIHRTSGSTQYSWRGEGGGGEFCTLTPEMHIATHWVTRMLNEFPCRCSMGRRPGVKCTSVKAGASFTPQFINGAVAAPIILFFYWKQRPFQAATRQHLTCVRQERSNNKCA